MENELLINIWKKRAPVQATWFSKHPTQIKNQANTVWQWAIKKGDGRAWVYFILAVCQWYPRTTESTLTVMPKRLSAFFVGRAAIQSFLYNKSSLEFNVISLKGKFDK